MQKLMNFELQTSCRNLSNWPHWSLKTSNHVQTWYNIEEGEMMSRNCKNLGGDVQPDLKPPIFVPKIRASHPQGVWMRRAPVATWMDGWYSISRPTTSATRCRAIGRASAATTTKKFRWKTFGVADWLLCFYCMTICSCSSWYFAKKLGQPKLAEKGEFASTAPATFEGKRVMVCASRVSWPGRSWSDMGSVRCQQGTWQDSCCTYIITMILICRF